MMGSPPSTDTTSSGYFLSAQCETPQGDEGDPSTTLLPTRDQRQTDDIDRTSSAPNTPPRFSAQEDRGRAPRQCGPHFKMISY